MMVEARGLRECRNMGAFSRVAGAATARKVRGREG